MSEYLTYTLWQQREQSMPQELEHHRVVQERLREQEQEAQLAAAPEAEVAEAPGLGQFRDDEYVLVDD